MRVMSLLLTVFAMMAPLAGHAQQPAMIQAPEPATSKAFRIDSNASWIRVLATPDGPLRRFGHYHVISHNEISGTVEVEPDPLESAIMLELSVASFVVDDPDLRKLEGEDFEAEVPQKDVDGTRANMLGERLLNAEEFPTIQIRSTAIDGTLPDANITATVSVIGTESTVTFPASIELTDDSFVASGQIEITHGEIGLSPFTAMGGALSVGDMLVLKYEISGIAVTHSEE